MKKIIMFVCLFLSLFAITSCSNIKTEYCIFQDIEECQSINFLNYTNGKVDEYDNPENDKKLSNLKYKDFFAGKYKSDELTFEIYAYQFENSSEAGQYFSNVTGKNSELETNFSSSQGLFNYELIVIDGECAYFVSTSKSHKEELLKVLEEIFSKKIDF